MSLDDLRKRHPQLGFAAYALTPGGLVTLEVHDNEQVFTFEGPTLAAAVAVAFPKPKPPEPLFPEKPLPPPPVNVFD